MEEIKSPQQAAREDAARAADAGCREAVSVGLQEDEEGSQECRICRSSAQELLQEAEATAGSEGGCCRLRSTLQPLRRLRCACTGSVRHVCARCYRRYYVARGIRACEICRQPTGLEGEDGDGEGFCQRLASFVCSDEVRYLVYAVFILVAFVSIFVLFFVASDADERNSAKSATPRPENQRRTERAIFVSVALVNLSFALAYIGYSFWRHCRGRRRRSGGSPGRRPDGLTTAVQQPPIEAVTVAILQQPPPMPSAPLLTPQLTSRTQQLLTERTFSV